MNYARWTPAQTDYVRAHWREQTDKQLAVSVSAIGPRRTQQGISDWRNANRLVRPLPCPVWMTEDQRSEHRKIAISRTRGWPVVLGDKEFLRRLRAWFAANREAA